MPHSLRILCLLLCCFPLFVSAQSEILHVEDLFFESEGFSMTLVCKEKIKTGIKVYEFYNGLEENATLLQTLSNISPGSDAVSILSLKLRNEIGDSISKNFTQANKQKINTIVAKSKFSDIDKKSINELLIASAMRLVSDLPNLNVELDNLSTKFPNDTVWVNEKKANATALHNQTKPAREQYLTGILSKFIAAAYVKTIEILEDAPEVGKITVNGKALLFKRESTEIEISKTDSVVEILDVEIEFENEQIQSIKVNARFNKEIYLFQNRAPLSYSSKRDVSGEEEWCNKKHNRLYATKKINNFTSYINVCEVLKNDYRLLNGTENYSTKNQVITIRPGEVGKVLYKEKTINILKAKVFTDFFGFDNANPNGIIQTEVSHRFYFGVNPWSRGRYFYWGMLNSAMPKITFSKIEENNRVLNVESVLTTDSQGMDTLNLFTRPIDLFSHTNWTSGGEINFLYFGFPRMHSMIYINLGAYVRHVRLRLPESSGNTPITPTPSINADEDGEFSINTLTLYPEAVWSYRPDSRYRLSYSAKVFFLFPLLDDITVLEQRPELDMGESFDSLNSSERATIVSLKFLAALRLNENGNGELFFRTYWNFNPDNTKQNFFQAQLGYSFNIFGKKSRDDNSAIPNNL